MRRTSNRARHLPDPELRYRPVKLMRNSDVILEGQTISVGTYDLGRRYKVLHEGQFPPFKERFAVFQCARLGNGRLIWGERIE